MVFTLVGPPGSDTPTAVVGDAWRAGAEYDPSEAPLARFEAGSRAAASAELRRVGEIGVRTAYAKHGRRPDAPWRAKGVPHYLANQALRLAIPQTAVEHARVVDNRQLAKISTLLSQVQRDYYDAPRHGDDRAFTPMQVRAVVGILGQCEAEIGKVHAIAAAGSEMVDEAWNAVGMTPPIRAFSVVAAAESPAESVEDARPAAATDEEVASLRAELDRLRAENADLAERLTTPAEPAIAPTSPTANPHRRHPARN